MKEASDSRRFSRLFCWAPWGARRERGRIAAEVGDTSASGVGSTAAVIADAAVLPALKDRTANVDRSGVSGAAGSYRIDSEAGKELAADDIGFEVILVCTITARSSRACLSLICVGNFQ